MDDSGPSGFPLYCRVQAQRPDTACESGDFGLRDEDGELIGAWGWAPRAGSNRC